MFNRSDYQLSYQETIDRFRNAKPNPQLAEEIGKKNILGDEVLYWYGVLLARLEGVIPPFRPGDEVEVVFGCGLVQSPAPDGPTLDDHNGSRYVVNRVWYHGGSWFLEFDLMATPRCHPYYVADFFVLDS